MTDIESLAFHLHEIEEIIMCGNSLMIIEEEDESTDAGNYVIRVDTEAGKYVLRVTEAGNYIFCVITEDGDSPRSFH